MEKVAPGEQIPRLSTRQKSVEWIRRGYDNRKPQHYKRKPGFFAIKIQKQFEFTPDWHQKEGVSDLVQQYHFVLDSVLKTKPHLEQYLVHCRHCGILFITDPRNANRRDLGCPFGCREANRKQRSTERSVAYYRTEEGKFKKKLLNIKRNGAQTKLEREEGRPQEEERPPERKQLDGRVEGVEPTPQIKGRPEEEEKLPGRKQLDGRVEGVEPTPQIKGRPEEEEEPPENEQLDGRVEGAGFDAGMVSYLRMVIGLIEGRRVRREEILEMLVRVMRQHSMARRKRMDYFVWYLNKHPP